MIDLNIIQSKNILVIGDVMLDTYYTGEVKRISPEAPVPIFRKESERSVLGGAANVAANLVATMQNVSVMTVVGNDFVGEKLKDLFIKQGINTDLVFPLDRHTTEKTRFLASNNQQVLRFDVEDTEEINTDECNFLLGKLQDKITTFDLIIVSDYLKGLLTFEFTQGVIKLAKKNNIPIIIDVKDSKFTKYMGATLLKPNLNELHNLTGMAIDTDEQIVEASRALKENCFVDYVLTTCGGRGMVLVQDNSHYFISAYGHEVFDVTGAGDTTIAYLGACMVNGLSMQKSVDIANVVAGIKVSKAGTSCVYWSEIKEKVSSLTGGTKHKIVEAMALDSICIEHHKKIVFMNDCTDGIKIEYVRHLQEVSTLGEILVLGLNSNAYLNNIGEHDINKRRIYLLERAELLAALSVVDYVIIYNEDKFLELITKIEPSVLVKNSDDYLPNEENIKREIVSYGGKLVCIPFMSCKDDLD